MAVLGPRIVVAGTHSGVGKTTVATGLMAALRHAGLRVGAAKVGPDFIDPGYHSLAISRPSRNLDPWMCGDEWMPALAGRAGADTDLLVIEGVMGLFDGAADGTPSSTADVAARLDAPIILVVDASAMSQSVAALVQGFAAFDPRARIAGLILNRVRSAGHRVLLEDALRPLGIPVVGVLGRDDHLKWRDRHLGLVPVAEAAVEVRRSLDRLSALVAEACDLTAIEAIAASALPTTVGEPPMPEPVGHVRIAVAAGPAFSFTYPDNLEVLTAAGAEVVPFDPCSDIALPEGCGGLIAGGGFPEVFAEQLGANHPLLADLRRQAGTSLVTWAECGGLLWLCRSLDGITLAGTVAGEATMTGRLTLGYRRAVTTAPSPLGPAGTNFRGHEFHYSTIEPTGSLLTLSGRHGANGDGFGHTRMLASYLHVHLGTRPDLARAFVAACRPGSTAATSPYLCPT